MNISKAIDQRLKHYRLSKAKIDEDKFRFIPFWGFDKLATYIPGIIPGIMYKITSHSGMGKTQLSKFLFVYQPLLYCLSNNKKNFKVVYISPEETKEEFIDGLFKHVVKRKTGHNLDRFAMAGHSLKSLTEKELQAIENCRQDAMLLAENIYVLDNVYSPDEMYREVKKLASKWGTFSNNDSEYTPHNPDEVVLLVTDHISLISEQYDAESKTWQGKHKAISVWHTEYVKRHITKIWQWAALNVQQQSLESEKQVYTSAGKSVMEKTYPTLDGLGDNKIVARDDYVVLGIWSPERYGITTYKNYDISQFKDNFRTIHFLKNRFGPVNKILPTYFDGSYTYFEELPKPMDPKMDEYYNKKLKKKHGTST